MVRTIILAITCWVGFTMGTFGNEFQISSALSKSKVYSNERFELTLTVEGADKDLYRSIELPDFKSNFTIVSTSQSSSFSFVNGVSNRTRQYRYALVPNQSGIFIIDPFKITYNGKSYTTKPLRVVVREGTIANQKSQTRLPVNPLSRAQSQSKSIFLETQISTKNIFIGESINYSIKLYRRISLWSSISIDQDDLEQVWQTNNDTSPERVVRKFGQRYYELELVNKNIQPLQEGMLSIPPLIARFVVDPFSGEYQLQSNVVTINVQGLPNPKPPSFTGAIGNYSMRVATPQKTVSSNTFQIQVKISGDGHKSTIKPPVIQDSSFYRVLTAPRTKEDVATIDTQVFDYVIIPNTTGIIQVPPIIFSFFSKDTMDYVTLRSKPFELNVDSDDIALDEENQILNQDIQFLAMNSVSNQLISNLNNPNLRIGLMAINGLLLLIIVLIAIKKSIGGRVENKSKKRRRLIQKVQNLNQQTSLSEMEQTLVEVLVFFTNYSHQSVHPKSVEKALISAELSDPLIKSTMQWIKTTQVLQFSKEKTADQSHSNSDSLKRILTGIIKEVER